MSKYNFAVYSQMKDEDHIIETWVNHYFQLGFEHLYIMDDLSETPISETIKNHPRIKDISVIRVDFTSDQFYNNDIYYSNLFDNTLYTNFKFSKQIYFLNIFKKLYENEFEWLFICDADEFLFLRNENTIQEYMNQYISEYSDIGQILFLWCVFGTSYHSYFPDGHLFENFVLCNENINFHTKSLIKAKCAKKFDIHTCTLNLNKTHYITEPNTNKLICVDEFEKKYFNINKLTTNPVNIKINELSAYCCHYMSQDCYTFVKRKIKRLRAAVNLFRNNDFIKLINLCNSYKNYDMLKYIQGKNPKINNYELNMKIDIDKYNKKYNTNFNNINDMLIHFYYNKTMILYKDITLPSNFDVSIYKKLNSDLQKLSDVDAKYHYIEYGIKENRRYN